MLVYQFIESSCEIDVVSSDPMSTMNSVFLSDMGAFGGGGTDLTTLIFVLLFL